MEDESYPLWTSAKFPEPNMFPIVRSLRGIVLTMTKHDGGGNTLRFQGKNGIEDFI